MKPRSIVLIDALSKTTYESMKILEKLSFQLNYHERKRASIRFGVHNTLQNCHNNENETVLKLNDISVTSMVWNHVYDI